MQHDNLICIAWPQMKYMSQTLFSYKNCGFL